MCAYRSVAQLGASSLASEVCDWRRFGRASAFMGFTGLVPSEFSSGGKTSRAHITMAERGQPEVAGAICFIGGALVAMALVLLAVFDGAREMQRSGPRHFGLGGVHVIAVPGGLVVGWALATAIACHWLAYLAAGFGSTIGYQLLLGLEALITADDHR